jgi:hypothetical protein
MEYVRATGAQRAVTYVSQCETFVDPFGYKAFGVSESVQVGLAPTDASQIAV